MNTFIIIWLSTVPALQTTLFTTPVFSFIPNKKLHHIVLLSLGSEITHINSNIMNDIYIIDYTPSDDINFKIGWQLFLGQKIKGHIRIVHMDKINKATFIDDWYNETKFNILPHIDDQRIQTIIMNWDNTFQIHEHNCQHFAKYFIKEVTGLREHQLF